MFTSRLYRWPLLAVMFTFLSPLYTGVCRVLAQSADKTQSPANETAGEQATATDEDVAEIQRQLKEAVELHESGRFDEAIDRERSVLKINERLFGPASPSAAQALHLIGITAQAKGDLALAGQMLQRALAIYQKSTGEESRETAEILAKLGKVWLDEGDFTRAGPALRQALSISEKVVGKTHRDYIFTLLSLADLYGHESDYDHAEQAYLDALALIKEGNGDDRQCLGCLLHGLAVVYREKGDFARAELTFIRALEVMREAFGDESANVARLIVEFADLQATKGDYGLAEEMYESALKRFEKIYGAEHPYVAITLTRQARMYIETGNLVRAAKLLERAAESYRKSLGSEHANVAGVMYELGKLYTAQRDFARAEPILYDALERTRRAFGENNNGTALAYNQLAYMYLLKGDYDRAKPLFQSALSIIEKLFGANSSNATPMLSNLAMVSLVKGDAAQAIYLMGRSNDISEYNLKLLLGTGSERQRLLFLNTLLGNVFGSISLHAQFAPDNPSAARLAFNTILRFKGRALDVLTSQIGILRRSADPQDHQLLKKFLSVRTQLASLLLDEAHTSDTVQDREKLHKLSLENERLEMQISAFSEMFRAQVQPVTMERVRAEIPPDAALVELIAYEPLRLDGKAGTTALRFGETRYAAYVLRDTGEPAFADLGEAATIDRAVTKLREALADQQSTNSRQAARALDEMVMRPVRDLVRDKRMLFLSPDGALNLVPFSALVDEHDKYLVENYTIVYLTSGRDLLQPWSQTRSWQPSLVMADPLFGSEPVPAAKGSDAGGRRSADFTQFTYRPLPGTAAEASAIGELLHVKPLMQEQATEMALKQAHRPRILHVATHGFFLPDKEQGTANSSGPSTLAAVRGAARRENPLLRSGLVLAGVMNRRSGEGEDGVLTALEATGLDLWGTQLVVLSACNTAMGEVLNGDGVAGLRRALVLAGSQSQLISLWKISDTATKDLMVDYYKRLLAGARRGEALRQVQLAMLQGKLLPLPATDSDKQKGKRETGDVGGEVSGKDYRHPYYWAAFIPSGDWRSMDGK
ncbi:MAG TPA: CHAT domain-containing protein [Pyrinomonadaceae bacterium]|jgi:CHAT domain-containing protein/Tfp pilus assembly protein PilF